VEEINSFLAEEHWILVRALKERDHLAQLGFRIHPFGKVPVAFVLVVVSSKVHALLLVAQEGNEDGEFRKALHLAFWVALLPLLTFDGDVVVSLRVVESEDCATSCEELWESEGVYIRTDHSVRVCLIT